MADERIELDPLGRQTVAGVTDDANTDITQLRLDPTTKALLVTLKTLLAGEDLTNDVLKVEQRSQFLQGTTSQLVKSGAGRAFGIMITAASATPTVKLWNNTAASGAVLVDTFTPTAGQVYNLFGASFDTGLFITVSGTVAYTIFYK